MPPSSVYYDTCVFLVGKNPSHEQCTACAEILPDNIVPWVVCLTEELSNAEASVAQLIDNYLVFWAVSGVNVRLGSMDAVKTRTKRHRRERTSLRQLGFDGFDFKHLMSAVDLQAEVLCSVDEDFFDPKIKAGGSVNNGTVRKAIENAFPIKIQKASSLVGPLKKIAKG